MRMVLTVVPYVAIACGPTPDAAPAADAGPDAEVSEEMEEFVCPLPGEPAAKEAVFTVPDAEGSQDDLSIEDALARLIEGAVPGGRIRVAIYHFSRPRLAEALIAAAERGVDVGVVVDEKNQVEEPEGSGRWSWNPAVTLLRGALTGRMVMCGGGQTPPDGGACHGTTINHNKFLIVSETCDGARDVVAQTSMNFGDEQLRLHNNLVIVRGDGALFAGYEGYWEDLATDTENRDYDGRVVGDTGTRAFFFPKASSAGTGAVEPSTDPIHNLLDNVDCSAGTQVRVAMAYWTRRRSYLAEDLGRMADAGCQVQVAYYPGGTETEVESALKAALVDEELRGARHVHSKYLLVDGVYAGEDLRAVWTGSHNFTHGALRENDEALLRIDDDAIYQAFRDDWQVIFDRGEP